MKSNPRALCDACANQEMAVALDCFERSEAAKAQGEEPTCECGPIRCDHDGQERWCEREQHVNDRDFTVSASTDAVVIALLRRLQGHCRPGSATIVLTANELARAEQVSLERRADGNTLRLSVVGDT